MLIVYISIYVLIGAIVCGITTQRYNLYHTIPDELFTITISFWLWPIYLSYKIITSISIGISYLSDYVVKKVKIF